MANVFQKRRQMIDEASGYASPKKKEKAKPKTKPKAKKLPPLGKKYDPADYPR